MTPACLADSLSRWLDLVAAFVVDLSARIRRAGVPAYFLWTGAPSI